MNKKEKINKKQYHVNDAKSGIESPCTKEEHQEAISDGVKFKKNDEFKTSGMKLYRYDDSIRYYQDDGYHFEENAKLTFSEYEVIKETICGYWLKDVNDDFYPGKRWMDKKARKRFAYETKEEALQSYLSRKKYQIIILEKELVTAKTNLNISKKLMS